MSPNLDPLSPEVAKLIPVRVGMKEWAKSAPETPILETWGLGPCIGIAAYNTDTKTGHLYHIAVPLFERSQIKDFFDSILASGNKQDLKIWVRGGQKDAEMAKTFDLPQMGRDTITEKLAELELPEGNLDLQWDDEPMGARSTSMSLNAETGEFTTGFKVTDQALEKIGGVALGPEP